MEGYSYVVVHDTGLAPNPFHGYCTLAVCKWRIREYASKSDWIIGTGSASGPLAHRLVYAMQVDDALTFDDYWKDPRFQCKKPNLEGRPMEVCGDNIYHCGEDGEWIQARSLHNMGEAAIDEERLRHDTRSEWILLSEKFAYFGANAIHFPNEFRPHMATEQYLGMSVRNYYKLKPPVLEDLIEWLDKSNLWGVQGLPLHFDELENPRQCGRRPSESTRKAARRPC